MDDKTAAMCASGIDTTRRHARTHESIQTHAQIGACDRGDVQQLGEHLGQLHCTLLVGGTGRFRSNAELLRRGRTMRPKSNAPR
jgi:hypothetical protein